MTLKGSRWRISTAAAVAAAAGALLKDPGSKLRAIGVFAGSILFALATTWFNQIQEREDDGRLLRTKNRPLARNTLPAIYAFLWAVCCLTLSFVILFIYGGWVAAGILLTALVLYNGFYTLMKGRTMLALIPGAWAGAFPPLLGWVCAGGAMTERMPLIMFLLFFLWQVPHFWLAEDRNRLDYERACLPLPWRSFGDEHYLRVLAVWVMAYCVALTGLPAFRLVTSPEAQSAVICISAGLLIGLFRLGSRRPNLLFHFINSSMGVTCIIMVADKMYRG